MGNQAYSYWLTGNSASSSNWQWYTDTTVYNTVTSSATTLERVQPGNAIPDLKESEVGRLRRSVKDMCVEGRSLLEAA